MVIGDKVYCLKSKIDIHGCYAHTKGKMYKIENIVHDIEGVYLIFLTSNNGGILMYKYKNDGKNVNLGAGQFKHYFILMNELRRIKLKRLAML